MANAPKPRLGNDPFAALGVAGSTAKAEADATVPPEKPARTSTKAKPGAAPKAQPAVAAKPKAATRPERGSARSKGKTTAQGHGHVVPQGPKPSPLTATAAAPRPSAATAPVAPAVDLAALENRLHAAFQAFAELDLPTSPPPKRIRDEFFELLRGVLRLVSPIHYLQLYSQFAHGDRSMNIDPFGLDPVFEERAERIADFLYRRWWRVDARGLENVPLGGRALIVSNHSGMLPYDGAMIKHAVRVEHPARRTVRFLVENFVFYFPFLGTLVYRYGGVRASMDNAQRLLNDEQLTAVFPEGVKGLGKHYRYRYQLQRFGRGGFIRLALATRSPIIPVAVIGAEEIHPIIGNLNWLAKPLRVPYVPVTPTLPWLGPLGLIPFPSKWTIVFGEPLMFPLEYGPEEVDNDMLIQELTLKVRRIIHAQIYERLAERQSVYFG